MPVFVKICILYVVNYCVFFILKIKRLFDIVEDPDEISIKDIWKGGYILPFNFPNIGSTIVLIVALLIIGGYFGINV